MNRQELVDHARALFAQRFGEAPTITTVAPGRVNLIGEHTDYHHGFVFPAAIDRYVVVAGAPCPGPSQLYSEELSSEFSLGDYASDPQKWPLWARYSAGMAQVMGARQPVRAVAVSNLPRGAGLSSSAAIEMAFGVFFNELDGLGHSNQELARLGRICENTV